MKITFYLEYIYNRLLYLFNEFINFSCTLTSNVNSETWVQTICLELKSQLLCKIYVCFNIKLNYIISLYFNVVFPKKTCNFYSLEFFLNRLLIH